MASNDAEPSSSSGLGSLVDEGMKPALADDNATLQYYPYKKSEDFDEFGSGTTTLASSEIIFQKPYFGVGSFKIYAGLSDGGGSIRLTNGKEYSRSTPEDLLIPFRYIGRFYMHCYLLG